MNENIKPSTSTTPAWRDDGRPTPVPNTSMLPGAEKAPAAADQMMKRAVEGAHATVDRLADSAAPAVRQLGEGLSSAQAALQAGTDQFRQTRDEWAESLRGTVRRNPLASVATALALGALVARITR